ncbi:MAG TPA: ABC transporter permease [Vicinamibacterales bacterium]|nr:ABC transporter permease [Vicinamibacterales bacterium]
MTHSMRRLRHVIRKEFLELRQDPRLFSLVIIAPILQLTMLGYAATTDVKNVPIVIVDQDRSAPSRDLVSRFEASPNFEVVGTLSSSEEVGPYLDQGRAWMALVIPADYSEQVGQQQPVTVQVVADGSDANSTNVALGYASALVASYARDLAAPGGRTGGPLIGAEIRVWFNPQLESRHFMIPGILALILLLITTNLSSMAIVREKELGTLEQLNVTPIARWELIAGKLLPYALLGMIDVALVLVVAVGWFEVPLRGSLTLLVAMCLVYLLTTLGLGLFVSTISATQQQAMMTASFFFLVPMVFLSGFVFPIENMPDVIQPVTYLIPLRYFLEILRGIFLKGVGLEVLWKDAAALFAWGVAILTLATVRSSKRTA